MGRLKIRSEAFSLMGKVSPFMTQVGKCSLQMQRQRVIDRRGDAGFLAAFLATPSAGR